VEPDGADTFEEFILDELPPLFRALLLVTGERGAAESLAREAMARLADRWEQLDGADARQDHLYRTAFELNRHPLRRRAALRRRVVGSPSGQRRGRPIAEAPAEVLRAMAGLSRPGREAVAMVEVLGLPPSDAARRLGVEVSGLQAHLDHAGPAMRGTARRLRPAPGRTAADGQAVQDVLDRVRQREVRRSVYSGAVGFGMFGAVMVAMAVATGLAPSGVTRTPFDPAEDVDAPSVAHVVCGDGVTEAVDWDVAARADGVHYSVTNGSDVPVTFRGAATLAPGATADFVMGDDPGTATVACHPVSRKRPRADEVVDVVVHDPRRYWLSYGLVCSASQTHGFGESGGRRKLPPAPPEDLVREQYDELILPADVVRRTGYPQGDSRTVAVIREGGTVAIALVVAADDEGWYVDGFAACSAFLEGAAGSPLPGPPADQSTG
jgi:DNA-directed RNA polymerase specialized sigma24 family protein